MFLLVLGASPIGTPGDQTPKEEAEQKRSRTQQGLAQLIAEYHQRLSRHEAHAIGAIYARYSSRHQDSIVDQVRTLLEEAIQRKIFIPAECIFYDMSVRGYQNDRDGLNELRACLQSKAITVVLFFATNRLFRKSYRSLQFVEEQVVERGIRAIFVKSGVDTADSKRWRSLMNVHAMMDEFVVSMNVENIRASHEGLIEKSMVFGTISYGYRGEPIPGQLTRKGRARCQIVVDETAAIVVRLIFQWYVRDRLPVQEIIRRLTADATLTLPPKCRGRGWSRQSVIGILKNTRYRGCWMYGTTETQWVSSKDYARQLRRDKPLKVVQLDALRIVEDDQWYSAQRLLQDEAARMVGRKPKTEDAASRSRLLNGLFICPTHKRKLYVGGPGGRILFCKECQTLPAEQRPLFSHLPRELALRLTCETVARMIRNDTELIDRIVGVCQRIAVEQQTPNPGRITAITTAVKKLDQRIEWILRNPGEAEDDQRQSQSVIKQLRQERTTLQMELEALNASGRKAIVVPTVQEVQSLIQELDRVLLLAATGTLEEIGRVRQLIELVTGGTIELFQQGERRAKRGWLQGRFVNRLTSALIELLCRRGAPGEQDPQSIAIEYRPQTEELSEAVRAEIMRRYQAGELVKRIAQALDLNRNRVTQVIAEWHVQEKRVYIDGRTRRSGLSLKHMEQTKYQTCAERVKELADQGWLFGAIAEQLELDRNTVTAAWKYWHTSRNMLVPDGRTRRKWLSSGHSPTVQTPNQDGS